MTKAELAEKILAATSLSKHDSQFETTKSRPHQGGFFMHHT